MAYLDFNPVNKTHETMNCIKRNIKVEKFQDVKSTLAGAKKENCKEEDEPLAEIRAAAAKGSKCRIVEFWKRNELR